MNSQKLYPVLPYLACLFACVIVNLVYFPPGTIFPDEQRFLGSAIKLAASGEFWVGNDRAWEMPGTALFFAPWIWLFGPKAAVIAIRFCQSILLVAQCGFVAFTVRRTMSNELAAFIASCIVAVYPFFLFYQGLLLSETLFNTLLLAGVASLYLWRERGAQIDGVLVLACGCFAAATLTKASLTILPPFLFVVAAWTKGVTWRRISTVLLTAACLYAAFLSPWWIRNAALFGSFVPFTTSSAENLYLGNNPNNSSGGIDWSHDVELSVATRLLALPNEVERQRAFSKAAVTYIQEHPAAFLHLAWKKFLRFWSIVPNAVEFRGAYALISAATFGPILTLALIGVVRQRQHWRMLAPLLIIAVYFTFLHTVTIASLRYRLPIEPILIILSVEPTAALLARAMPRVANIK